jgi:hypothetical protein
LRRRLGTRGAIFFICKREGGIDLQNLNIQRNLGNFCGLEHERNSHVWATSRYASRSVMNEARKHE